MSEQAKKTKSRIKAFHVGRVYNLGNYENMRVEVIVDVAEGDDPTKLFRTLEAILKDLHAKSGLRSYDLQRAKEQLSKPRSELTDTEKKRLPEYRKQVKQYESAQKARERARQALATLNYTSEYRDAKDSWEDDY